jgi:hypothetical protein
VNFYELTLVAESDNAKLTITSVPISFCALGDDGLHEAVDSALTKAKVKPRLKASRVASALLELLGDDADDYADIRISSLWRLTLQRIDVYVRKVNTSTPQPDWYDAAMAHLSAATALLQQSTRPEMEKVTSELSDLTTRVYLLPEVL